MTLFVDTSVWSLAFRPRAPDFRKSWYDNPSASVAFGVYGSQPDNYIFFRENC